MTDLDSTEILTADESFAENASTNHTKASLKIISGTDPNTFEINKETTIGRSSPSDLIIAAVSLSKQHAKITFSNGQYFITDLGSSNKTFRNKVQLQANVCYALHDGDEIKLGDIICAFEEHKQSNPATETEVDANPSTQTITNSYDDQEPAQPMKVWNKNNDSTDVTPKQNGINDSPNKSSSSFVSHLPTSSTTTNNDDDDDDDKNLIIGSTSSPAAVPVVSEPQPSNKDDALPSPQENTEKKDPITSVNERVAEEDQNIADTTSKEPPVEEEMDTDQNNESPSMVIDEEQPDDLNEAEEEEAPTTMEQETAPAGESVPVSGRGVPRKNVRRARGRGRRGAGARARVISTRLHGGRRQAIVPPTTTATEENNATLEETVNTETEESPKKPTRTSEGKAKKSVVTPEDKPSQETTTASNVRISARIKERASSGRTRQYPYADDYVNLDDIEKQSKATAAEAATATTTTPAAAGRKSNRGRPSASPQKRISLRQQPIDASGSSEQKSNTDVYEDIDAVAENKEPTPKSTGRKRKSTTPVSPITTKRSRPITPQTMPTLNTRLKQATTVEQSPTVAKSGRRSTGGQQQPATTVTTSPKRGRKSAKSITPTDQSPEKQSAATDRPVRIALSSHLNFDQNHIDILRKLGFEILDETSPVDALVVDRIRRTKKFFMCLARGAHILSPTWIESMIKENRYIPYDKYYLEDTNAETRYGFQLRESVRLAKQGPIFANRKFFCTKDTSPPYDDLKDIIEAAGGKLIEKINITKPGKDVICIVAQVHKNDYEDLFKKGLAIVSEEFILSGISKQKLDFQAFSLFQNVPTIPSK